jgi:hypothetical protein
LRKSNTDGVFKSLKILDIAACEKIQQLFQFLVSSCIISPDLEGFVSGYHKQYLSHPARNFAAPDQWIRDLATNSTQKFGRLLFTDYGTHEIFTSLVAFSH